MTYADHADEIEERLLALLDRLVAIPADRREDTRCLACHDEGGVALENLCQQLDDDDIAVSPDILRELEDLAEIMGMQLRVRPEVAPAR